MSNNVSKLAEELLLRRNARRSLDDWARLNGFEPARHHQFLNRKLEAVARGEIRRLMVFMPPGSAKSTYSSVLFPPWFLAQRNNINILSASHSADLAVQWGRRARNIVDEKGKILGYSLRKDSQAADEWGTDNGSVFFCAGVGGRIAGRRADLGLIDDPVGSKEDAYSKVIRDKTWDWYKYDFTTRLKPGAAVVIIQTRWHEEDLSGRLLLEEPDDWEVINLPMLAKDNDALGRAKGELLWTEWFGKDEKLLRDAQADKSKWSALYQQDPTPEDGDYFQRAWIEGNAYDRSELPSLSELVTYCASDHAVSLKEEADSTCLVSVGADEKGTVWVLPDLYWNKCDSMEAVQQMLNMMRRVNPLTWWAEADKIGKSIGPFLKKRMREEMVFCYIEEMHPTKDKMARARSLQGRMQAGAVRFPRFAPWYQEALLQLLKFPAGAHDDFIDPLAYIGLGLDKITHGSRPPTPVDETQHLEYRPITMRWIKDSHKRKERKELALKRDL